ncbi:MAG: phosphoribosyl-ATP pyrophosphohydrolase/phosphoribosyl-AMP cyclohydrolase [Phycisphaerales bacterium]|jgi:phosphoribosyl-ATP pyrophosphohydrolase/phosphoribosyl-AMP cyclohydrolase
MMIPSIDLMNGRAVQLVGGEEKVIDAGDPRPIAEKFGRVGEIAVIDLDAAMGTGSNAELISELLHLAPCRVGGGIRDAQTAIDWLDSGARKVILGTAAEPGVLRELPRERVIAALDSVDGAIVDKGWTRHTGAKLEDKIDELREFVDGFLVTFVEREGRMTGLPMDRVRTIVKRAGRARVTVAGGVRAAEDVALTDQAGADVQVGMSLYTGAMGLGEGFCAPLTSDRLDGLWPSVVVDELGNSLGLVYSSAKSVIKSLETGRGVYLSRSRNELWEKGATSGNAQELIRIEADCDRDALRFTVRQRGGGFCHTGTRSCFGESRGLGALERTIRDRLRNAPEDSYTERLVSDPGLLGRKLIEEAGELAEAITPEEAGWEAADVIYFALTAAISKGSSLEDIERELDRRAGKVSRRPGNAKESV